jgi:hypothetical protein
MTRSASARRFASGCRSATDAAPAKISTMQDLLDDRLRVLGPDHPHTLNTRHNFAHWRGRAESQ